MSERAAPFHCPYCADEDLRPFGESHGEWRCGACQRAFALKYLGIAAGWGNQPAAEVGRQSQPVAEAGRQSQPVAEERS